MKNLKYQDIVPFVSMSCLAASVGCYEKISGIAIVVEIPSDFDKAIMLRHRELGKVVHVLY